MNNFPIKDGLAQSDLDLANFRPKNADLSDYAGVNLAWNSVTKKLDASGGNPPGVYNVKDYGLLGDGVTDDTDALQALMDLVASNGGGTIFFPDEGPYIIAGALQDTSYRNAQLILPTFNVVGTQVYPSIRFKGFCTPNASGQPDGGTLVSGTVIQSTLSAGSGSSPAVICGRGDSGSAFDESSALQVYMEDLTWVTVQNPSYSCLNLRHNTLVGLNNVNVIAGAGVTPVEPTTSTSYGIILPDNDRTLGLNLDGQINVINFYNGWRWGELARAQQVAALYCKVGIEFGFAHHSTIIDRYLNYHNTRGALVSGVHPFRILQFDTERLDDGSGGQWNSPLYELDDVGNNGSGEINWLTIQAFVGRVHTFAVNSGSGLRITELGSDDPSVVLKQPAFSTPTTINQIVACLQAAGLCA